MLIKIFNFLEYKSKEGGKKIKINTIEYDKAKYKFIRMCSW